MAGQEKIRINKVLKEFNIGLGTLVEFLSKKGYEVESNPGAQISGEEYELVRKEYAKEQLIKEESRKIAIKVKEITKKESSRPEPSLRKYPSRLRKSPRKRPRNRNPKRNRLRTRSSSRPQPSIILPLLNPPSRRRRPILRP